MPATATRPPRRTPLASYRQSAKAAGVSAVVFDRVATATTAGSPLGGDGAREAGLEFHGEEDVESNDPAGTAVMVAVARRSPSTSSGS